MRRETSQIKATAEMVFQRGPKPIDLSRILISYCGTQLAFTMWCGLRTGLYYRQAGTNFNSGRSTSSKETRHWTFQNKSSCFCVGPGNFALAVTQHLRASEDGSSWRMIALTACEAHRSTIRERESRKKALDARTRLAREWQDICADLRRASYRYDRKVSPSLVEAHFDLEAIAWLSSDERARCTARRRPGPAFPWFDTRSLVGLPRASSSSRATPTQSRMTANLVRTISTRTSPWSSNDLRSQA